jgi:hypothetical protein
MSAAVAHAMVAVNVSVPLVMMTVRRLGVASVMWPCRRRRCESDDDDSRTKGQGNEANRPAKRSELNHTDFLIHTPDPAGAKAPTSEARMTNWVWPQQDAMRRGKSDFAVIPRSFRGNGT